MIKLPDDKVIITAALTGAVGTKEMNPNYPIQPEEIVADGYTCYNEGAAIIHIHARDEDGYPTGKADIFRKIHLGIKEKCDAILQDSTGGGPNLSLTEREDCINAGPEMASINMGTLLRTRGKYAGTAWINTREYIEQLATKMKERGIKPEIEIYHHGMFREVSNLIKKDLLEKPYYIDLITGMNYQGAAEATPKNLMMYLDFLPEETIFNVLSVGYPYQNTLTTMGMILGSCIRVGLEDNVFYRKDELATNGQLVARAVRIARELGKEPATPEEARQILGLKSLRH